MKPTSCRTALGLVGGALGLLCAIAPAPAQAATTGWRVYDQIPVDRGGFVAELTSVAVVSATDAWAAGDSFDDVGTGPAILLHWTGKAWSHVKLPAKVAAFWNANGGGEAVDVVGASSAHSVWAFDGGGGFIHLSSHGWTTGMVPGTSDAYLRAVTVSAVKVFSPTDVWIFGGISKGAHFADAIPYAAYFNGKKWRRTAVPGSGGVAGVSAISEHDIWAVAGPTRASSGVGTASVLRWTGKRWQPATVQPPKLPKGAGWTAVDARSNRDVWVAGGGSSPIGPAAGTRERIYHWTGKRWLMTALPGRASASEFSMVSLAPDGSGLWGLDSIVLTPMQGGPTPNVSPCSTIWHLSGTKWTGPTVLTGSACLYQLASVATGTSTWAVGTSLSDGLIALAGPAPR
jgi:hypothetical protein